MQARGAVIGKKRRTGGNMAKVTLLNPRSRELHGVPSYITACIIPRVCSLITGSPRHCLPSQGSKG